MSILGILATCASTGFVCGIIFAVVPTDPPPWTLVYWLKVLGCGLIFGCSAMAGLIVKMP